MEWKEAGIQVPPLMIVSITNQCNLKCVGCYSHEIHTSSESEMDDPRILELGNEAEELGISIILIAGGEPLLRPVFFDLVKEHPRILFLVFTNRLLINEQTIQKFKQQRNLIPVLSLEGQRSETDLRRGTGVFKIVEQKMSLLKTNHIFFGTSLTLTSQNFNLITSIDFQKQINRLGSQVSFFVDYVPIKPDSDHLVLSTEQKKRQPEWMRELRATLPGLFVALPGDEEQYGGCLAGGRGFIHVNPQGRVEACPFAPFSDTNLSTKSLKNALGSDLMKVIRSHANLLSESRGGCTLWENRAWVQEKMNELNP